MDNTVKVVEIDHVREKLIELVHEARGNAAWHNAPNPAEYVADYLLKYGVTLDNQVSSSKWIPVKERLPEDIGYVIISRLWWRPQVGWYINDSGEWVDFDGTVLHNVTHWMPLPEPPEEGT